MAITKTPEQRLGIVRQAISIGKHTFGIGPRAGYHRSVAAERR